MLIVKTALLITQFTLIILMMVLYQIFTDDWNSTNPRELLEEMRKNSKNDVVDVKWVFEPKL